MKFSKTYPFKNFTKDFEDKTSNLFYGFDVLSYSLNLQTGTIQEVYNSSKTTLCVPQGTFAFEEDFLLELNIV